MTGVEAGQGMRRALVAGALGGACAGLLDLAFAWPALTTVGVWRRLAAVGWSLAGVSVIGALGASIVAALVRSLARAHEERTRTRHAATIAAALAAPLCAYDAFAAFSGRRAATIPGRPAIVVALALFGTAAVFVLARGFARWIVRGERGTLPGFARLAAAASLAIWATLAQAANRVVLPRLYEWFHATLAALTLVLFVLAARLALARPRPVGHGKREALVGVVAVAVIVASTVVLLRSPSVRFVLQERTAIAGRLTVVLPAAPASLLAARRGGHDGPPATTAPLPPGPRCADADVVLVSVDAMRADHVGAYGYPRATTPNLDALARRGVRFNRAYAQAPHTSFSVTSLLTGKYYPTLTRLTPGDPKDPIAYLLRRYGWKTAAFFPPAVFFVDPEKLKPFRETWYQFEYVKEEFLDASARLDQIDAYFRTVAPRRAFVWWHLFEPHEPYDKRAGFDFGDDDVGRYDSEIAYADAAIGKLLAYLEKHRPGAIVIVTADHGEEFDEHGGRYHGSTLYEEQVRVPLIVAGPCIAPGVVEGPVELVDVAPTVLGLLDLAIPPRMRGTDLGPWLARPPAPATALPPVFGELDDQRMVVSGTDKLLCRLRTGHCRLFDLVADPRERRDLAEEQPARAARLAGLLSDWLDSHARLEPVLARGPANPEGGALPRPIERGRLGDPAVAVELAALAADPNAPVPVRQESARLVAGLPLDPRTEPHVVTALSAPDPRVADWAAVTASRLGVVRARDRLRRIVTDEPQDAAARDGRQRALRVHAALALADAGDTSGVPALADSLTDCSEYVDCKLVIGQLGRLADARAVPELIAHLSDVRHRQETVAALGAIGDRAAIAALEDRLENDEYSPVRAEAARALARIGGARARMSLELARKQEREPAVQAVLSELARGARSTRRRGGQREGSVDANTHSK